MKFKWLKRVTVGTIMAAICVAALCGGKISASAAPSEETGAARNDNVKKLVKVAKNEIGYTEEASGWTKYGQWYADMVGDQEYATANWSCMFAAWCGKEAGLSEDEFGYFGYTGYWVSWFKNNNAYHEPQNYKAQSGDIVFFDTNKDGKIDNVGIVEKNSWGKLSVIKGNVNKTVTRVKYSNKDEAIYGYGTPLGLENSGRLAKPILGIDVSSYNGNIDWNQVKTSDVKFAFVRCGYRGYGQGTFAKDKAFEKNMQGALSIGLDVGVYFVTQAITVEEAIEEADWVLNLIKNYDVKYPVVIDTEQASPTERSKDLTKSERTAIIKAFCDRVEEKGYKSQIYSGKYWFKDKLNMSELEGYDIWVAEYTHNQNGQTSFEHDYSIWQYSDSGVVPGINGVVDVNNCYVDYISDDEDDGWFSNLFN
ncbi:MAG: hypothetical protein E7262_07030 [Lachnospiraceae bacterium]|nr:hypothetical protein [Lachnospiraceae bacterium]